MCKGVSLVYMPVHHLHPRGAQRRLDSLEMELLLAVSHHVSAGTQTQFLRQSGQCSYPLSQFPNLPILAPNIVNTDRFDLHNQKLCGSKEKILRITE